MISSRVFSLLPGESIQCLLGDISPSSLSLIVGEVLDGFVLRVGAAEGVLVRHRAQQGLVRGVLVGSSVHLNH